MSVGAVVAEGLLGQAGAGFGGLVALVLAGEQAVGEWKYGSRLMPNVSSAGTSSASALRLYSEYSFCAVMKCGAPSDSASQSAFTTSHAVMFDDPDVADLAGGHQVTQRVEGFLQRRHPVGGAAGTGRCGRCRACAGCPDGPGDASRAAGASRSPRRTGRVSIPNLVAITTWSRRSPSALPSICSLTRELQLSAVSKKLIPASTAASITLVVAFWSMRLPKALQPTPTDETMSPLVPRGW